MPDLSLTITIKVLEQGAQIVERLERATQRLGRTQQTVANARNQVSRSYDDETRAMNKLSALHDRVALASQRDIMTWQRMASSVDGHKKSVQQNYEALRQWRFQQMDIAMMYRAVSTGAFLAGTAITGSIIALERFALSYGDVRTKVRMGFDNLLNEREGQPGYTKDLDTYMAEFEELARISPFTSQQLLEMAQRMVAANMPLDNLTESFRDYGNMLAAAGRGTKEFGNIVYALAKIHARGYMTAREYNQMVTAGLNPQNVLGSYLTKQGIIGSPAELLALMKSRGLTAEMVDAAMRSEAQRPFYQGRMGQLAENVPSAALSKTLDTLQQILENLNRPVFQTILGALRMVNAFLDRMDERFNKMPKFLQGVFRVLFSVGVALVGIVGIILQGFGALYFLLNLRILASIGRMNAQLAETASLTQRIAMYMAEISGAGGMSAPIVAGGKAAVGGAAMGGAAATAARAASGALEGTAAAVGGGASAESAIVGAAGQAMENGRYVIPEVLGDSASAGAAAAQRAAAQAIQEMEAAQAASAAGSAASTAGKAGQALGIAGKLGKLGGPLFAVGFAIEMTTKVMDIYSRAAQVGFIRAFNEDWLKGWIDTLSVKLLSPWSGEWAKKLNDWIFGDVQESGKKVPETFGKGMESGKTVIEEQADRLLKEVEDRMPSSDAKKGPLSHLTASGRALVETFARGMSQAMPILDGVAVQMAMRAVPYAGLAPGSVSRSRGILTAPQAGYGWARGFLNSFMGGGGSLGNMMTATAIQAILSCVRTTIEPMPNRPIPSSRVSRYLGAAGAYFEDVSVNDEAGDLVVRVTPNNSLSGMASMLGAV